MEELNVVPPKIKVSGVIKIHEVINEVVKLYKNNFRLFIKISLFICMINMLNLTFTFVQYIFKNAKIALFYSSFEFIVIFPLLTYFTMKFSFVEYIVTANRYMERQIDIKSALDIASKKIWKFIGANIQYYLIIAIPFIGIIIPLMNMKNSIARFVIIGLFAIPFIYLATINGFAPLIVIFDDAKKKYFSMSKKLVKGDFWKTAFLTIIVIIAFSIPYYFYMYIFNTYGSIPKLNRYIISLINQLAFVFINPFIASLHVILYHKLRNCKRIA